MIKNILLKLLIVLSFSNISFAQVLNPVKWKFEITNETKEDALLVFKAKIDKGWHLYSQKISDDVGPIPTSFIFENNSNIELVGNVEESESITAFDNTFQIDLTYFSDSAIFTQKIKKLNADKITIKGYIESMVCDDERCLPPDETEFEFVLNSNEAVISESSNETKDSKGFWGIFLAGFFGGFLALLTPCVFPMIPLTVSFFTKQSKTRAKGIVNALIYGLSIVVIYVGLGFIITRALGPDALNALASNVWMNLAFFIIFFVFAISFLGAFEITLPSSWINKADSASEKGGLIGIFFMAFTLSLVSFSCTGPIIGTLLVEAAISGGVVGPLVGMAGFSIALALPFGLFAAFPGWLNSLPKSGGWLNSVKVVLGLLELALALKFLSNVDLAYHWGIITREVFIAFWIVIFSVLGFYLMGKIQFSHDSPVKYVSIPRLLLSVVTFTFVVYLIPGMWGAPLKIISGFPPPMFYTEGWTIGGNGINSNSENILEGSDPSHCPHNLSCFHDYNVGFEQAKKLNKPILLDFTGWSCVNCRKMEDKVWVDPRILKLLREDYILISLYVDDKTPLKESEKYISETTGKKIKTIGNKWSDFQTTKYKTNSQPYYVLLNHNEENLIEPIGYEPDIEKYLEYLEKGLEEFNKTKSKSQIIKISLQ
jgi:thiol:disulfide interchange protein